MLRFFALALLSATASAGCTDGGGGGCSPPVGAAWASWAMTDSTYTYCYNPGCPMQWLINNTASLPNPYRGVVGVDHYFTKQGMPCKGGEPQEFAMQDALSKEWKSHFPKMKFLAYRILSAVPYDMVVRNKILSDPTSVVRWASEPSAATKEAQHLNSSSKVAGTVCYNQISGCFNSPTRINDPKHKCAFRIQAAAYNWSNPAMASWFLNEVVKPTLVHSDGIWLDGIGPDNGAYMCAGVCCGFGATNSPLNQAQIDAHCKAQSAATTMVQKYLIANGGWEAQKCFTYVKAGLPTKKDTPAKCVANLKAGYARGLDHSKYSAIAAYTGRTGGNAGLEGTDAEAAGTVAAFLLMRGEHWFLGITNHNTMSMAVGKMITSDYGMPKGGMTAVAGKANVFQRVYDKATVTLDCNSFSGTFAEHA